MEAYIWLILASMLAVGILFGFFIGRSKGDTSAPKLRELEDKLSAANEEMQEYRTQVSQHFEKTATLFNQLTNDYREVYEHLAQSSEQLCGEQVAKLKSLTSDRNVLEGNKVESTGSETASQAPAEAAADTTGKEEITQQAEAQQTAAETETHAATEQKKGNGGAEEPVVSAAESVSKEQQAAEARTFH